MDKSAILQKYPPLMENLLLILHEFQNSNPRHFLSKDDLTMVANYLKKPYSSIYGVVSYYTLFSLTPRGKHIIRICNSPVCRMNGSRAIIATLRDNLKIDMGETTSDGLFTLETSECLGQCDTAPGLSIHETYYGGMTVPKITAILQEYRDQEKRRKSKKVR